MSIEGVDYSTARPSPAGLVAAGKQFVIRYGGPGSDNKHLHLDEAQALLDVGLTLVANAEGAEGGMLLGYDVGKSWAASADAAFRACGMPADRPIYLSVDKDVSDAQLPAIRAALDGAAAAIGRSRVGVYGGRRVILDAQKTGKAPWLWQTYAWSNIPVNGWVPGVHIQQYRNRVQVAGGDCDLNRAMTVDFGQWPIDPAHVAAPTHREDEDMGYLAKDDSNGTVYHVVAGWSFPLTAQALEDLAYLAVEGLYNFGPPKAHSDEWTQHTTAAGVVWIRRGWNADSFGPVAQSITEIENDVHQGVIHAVDDFVIAVLARLPDVTLTKAEVEEAVRDAFAGGLAPKATP